MSVLQVNAYQRSSWLAERATVICLTAAVVADLLQLPLTLGAIAAAASGVGFPAAVSLEAIDVAIDLAMSGLTMLLLGFHWVLLPTLFLELVPGIDVAPTWTACVAFVIWTRRRETGAGILRRSDNG